jgi:peroxiredoxin
MRYNLILPNKQEDINMDEELRIAFSKKEKIEQFLSKLDKLKLGGSIPEAQYQDLNAEYNLLLEEAEAAIKGAKARLRKEFEKKAHELDNLQKEHDLWQARLSVGEVRADSYLAQSKPLKKAIEQLKKEVPRLRIHVNATSSAELGGPARVAIPQMKIKKTQSGTSGGTKRARKSPAQVSSEVAAEKTATASAATLDNPVSPSKDEAFVSELLKEPVKPAPKTSSKLVSDRTYAAEERDYQWREPREGVLNAKRSVIVIGAAVVMVIVIFAIGRMLSPTVDRNPPVTPVPVITPTGAAAPVISDILILDVTDTAAVITWKTDRPATSQARVTEANAKMPYLTEPKTSLNTSHAVILANLKPGITYSFALISKDAGGNESIYDQGKPFTTLTSLTVGAEVGKAAPDFTLRTLDGKNLALSSLKGKVIFLNFWKRSCPACVREMPLMQSVFTKLSAEQATILAVNFLEDEAGVVSFRERWGLTFPILLDVKGDIAKSYNVSDTPVTFMINAQGVIKDIIVGRFETVEEIETAINSLLKAPGSK